MSLKGAVVCVAHHWITCPSMVNFAYIFILLTSEAPPLERNFSSTDPPRSWVPDTAIELTHGIRRQCAGRVGRRSVSNSISAFTERSLVETLCCWCNIHTWTILEGSAWTDGHCCFVWPVTTFPKGRMLDTVVNTTLLLFFSTVSKCLQLIIRLLALS